LKLSLVVPDFVTLSLEPLDFQMNKTGIFARLNYQNKMGFRFGHFFTQKELVSDMANKI
jgi:hypothetical protein